MRHFIILIVMLVTTFSACQQSKKYSNSNLKLEIAEHGLCVNAPRMTLNNAQPGVMLLVGKEEKSLNWFPEESKSPTRAKRRTPQGNAVDLTRTWRHPDGYELTWTICRLTENPGFTIRSTFTNNSKEDIRLKNFMLCQTGQEGLVCDGDPVGWWLLPAMNYSRQAGNLAQVFPSEKRLQEQSVWGYDRIPDDDPRNDDGHWRIFEDVITLYSDKDRGGMALGAVGPGVSYVQFNCRVDSGKILLEILSRMDEILVEPGESRQSEEVLVLAQPYQEALTNLFSWMAETHGARVKRQPVFGWCSWYDRLFDIDADHIEKIIETVKAQCNEQPFEVIQIDDGWQKSYGDWQANDKFPQGMALPASKIRDAGAIPGIWMAPILCETEKHDNWFQHQSGNLLDPTHPEAEKFIAASIQKMMDSGFRYYKFDYNSITDYRPYNPKMTSFQIMRHLFSLYRQAIGEESFMLACGAEQRPVVGLADASRIGWDTLARWKSYPIADDGLPTLPTDIFDGIFTTALTSMMNDILFACDPDVSYMLPRATSHIWQGPKETFIPEKHGLKWPGLQTFHSYAGLLGGMALVSEPLYQSKYKSQNAMRMLEIWNPPAPDKGWSMNGDIDPWGQQFGYVAKRPWGNFAAVVLWNMQDESADLDLDDYAVKVLGEKYHIWSFWDEQYLGIGDASFVAKNVQPRGCALVRLTPIADESSPLIVGSNLHIGMGSAELKSVESAAGDLKLELTNAGARNGKLFIFSLKPVEVQEVSGCQAAVVPYEKNIFALVLTDRSRTEKNSIHLITVDAALTNDASDDSTSRHNFSKASFGRFENEF